jgi:hypothetical protein
MVMPFASVVVRTQPPVVEVPIEVIVLAHT